MLRQQRSGSAFLFVVERERGLDLSLKGFVIDQCDGLMSEKCSSAIKDMNSVFKVRANLVPLESCWYSVFDFIVGFRGSTPIDGQFGNIAFDLLEITSKKKFDQNMIYSPLSIYIARGMTLRGAKGETTSEMIGIKSSDLFHKQLSECIKFCNVMEADRGTIQIANRLFLDENIHYLDIVTINVGGHIFQIFEDVLFWGAFLWARTLTPFVPNKSNL